MFNFKNNSLFQPHLNSIRERVAFQTGEMKLSKLVYVGAVHLILSVVEICMNSHPYIWAYHALRFWHDTYCGDLLTDQINKHNSAIGDIRKYGLENGPNWTKFMKGHKNHKKNCREDYLKMFDTEFALDYYF